MKISISIKKIMAVLLAITMLVSCVALFASCDTGETPDNDNKESENLGSDPADSGVDSDPIDSDPVDSDPVDSDPVDSDPADSGEDSEPADSTEDSETENIVREPDPIVEMVSYNIAYYEATKDIMTVYYEGQTLSDYTIAKRAQRLDTFVGHFMPDVIALQEVNHRWWPYLVSNEDSIITKYGYEWAGNSSAFRNKNGKGTIDTDLYNLLLWDPDKFEEIKSGVIRLGTKMVGDGNKDRQVTYAILRNRTTGVEAVYASTHLSTRGNDSLKTLNLEQAQALTEKLNNIADGRTIIVAGDFNANYSTPTYRHMTQTARFSDCRTHADIIRTEKYSSFRMWGKYLSSWNKGNSYPIDHIFYKGKAVHAEEWAILTDTYDKDGNISTDVSKVGTNYDLSDHLGVYVRFKEATN